MLVSEYQNFVAESDQFGDRSRPERLDISLYGLAGEVGSVVAAIKKRLLGKKESDWRLTNEEIEEELGDAFWYCFQLANIISDDRQVNILTYDIDHLRAEIGAENDRARRIEGVLTSERSQKFMEDTLDFPRDEAKIEVDSYQALAFLTARTAEETLVEVCLAVLWQLNAELLRQKLPDIERELNRTLPDRDMNDVLAEVIWHLSALASIYSISLSSIFKRNMDKVGARRRVARTPLFDGNFKKSEQLPRQFEIAFVTLGDDRARMYYNGKRLGDPLTDNSYENDGYRYHDVMHLANAAVLGWSPVLRKLLGKKRRSEPKIDEVEDGARAQIVEEAVIKAIHSEGLRLARLDQGEDAERARLFPNRNDISFRFLQLIRTFVSDLEARENLFWEWEEAIFVGHEIFHELRTEGQGTITIDMERQSLKFRPEVCIDINGSVAAFGSAVVPFDASEDDLRALLTNIERTRAEFGDIDSLRVQIVRKLAILDALGLGEEGIGLHRALDVTPVDNHRISVRGAGAVERALRGRHIVRFRTTLSKSSSAIHCTALGMADPVE
jgi:NTP pyrophosphatase (non-canonical NTP hydrolase)